MAVSLRASQHGLEIVDRARRKKGWTKNEEAWWGLALSSQAIALRAGVFTNTERLHQRLGEH